MTAAALPDASHIVITMCDGMDLNIVTREESVVLPRVEIEIVGDDDDEDEDVSPEDAAAVEKLVSDLKVEGEHPADCECEHDHEDGPPPPPRLESEIDAEHAPALYKSTKVIDLEDLAFPNALLGVATLAENAETLRIKAVPSSGYLGDWPLSFKNVVVFHEEMNYDYGPFMDEDDSDYETEDEDDEEAKAGEGSGEKAADKEEAKNAEEKDDEETDPDYVPGDDESDDEDETILCTSRFVVNITPSHPTTPRVTAALEDLINSLNNPLEEITVVFNVDKEYKQPKDYEPSDEEPPLLGFLLTLLTMCANDDSKITFVDFDTTGTEWLAKIPSIQGEETESDAAVAEAEAQAAFDAFINKGVEEVRADAKEDGLDIGTKRIINYVSRDAYKATVGDEQFKLDTQWAK